MAIDSQRYNERNDLRVCSRRCEWFFSSFDANKRYDIILILQLWPIQLLKIESN